MGLEVKKDVWTPVYEKAREIELLLKNDSAVDAIIEEVMTRIRDLSFVLEKALEADPVFEKFIGHDSMRPEKVNALLDLYKLSRVDDDKSESEECLARAKGIWWKIYGAISSMQYFVEGETLEGEDLDLDEFFETGKTAIMGTFGRRGSGKSVTFEIEPGLKAFMHKGTVANLLLNFARNASRHGMAGALLIKVYSVGDKIKIAVSDNGSGIHNPETRRKKYHEEFSGNGSSGLGLASANKRMRTFGGKILCRYTGGMDGGTKFILTLKNAAVEILDSEPTVEELAMACSEVLDDEAIEEIEASESFDDALGFVFTALIDAGVEDPEAFLIAKGILKRS